MPAAYVQNVIRYAKSAGFTETFNQLTFAHQGLAAELAITVDAPEATTSITAYIARLESKKTGWWEIAQKSRAQNVQDKGREYNFPVRRNQRREREIRRSSLLKVSHVTLPAEGEKPILL